MSNSNKVEELKTNRFVIRKSLIGKNQVITFTNKKGNVVKYNKMTKSNVIESKRFVIRKSLIGKNQVITFTNKKGDVIKYKSYTATNNIPTILRDKELV